MNDHITIQFWYTDTFGVRNHNGGVGCEPGNCFMAPDVSEKYQSQTLRLLEHLELAQ